MSRPLLGPIPPLLALLVLLSAGPGACRAPNGVSGPTHTDFEPVEGARHRVYLAEDVRALRQRKWSGREGAGDRNQDGRGLDHGAPVMESAITLIDDATVGVLFESSVAHLAFVRVALAEFRR